MVKELDYCPFCGCDEIASKYRKHKLGVAAYIRCNHCSAQGGTFIEGHEEAALESARQDWNQNSLRPKTLCDQIERWTSQLQYDAHSFWYKVKNWDW